LFPNKLPNTIPRVIWVFVKEQIALQNAIKLRLDTIKIRYPGYSVRAFARKVGISPATLSLLLKGKRKISQKLARRLSDKLNFDPQERAAVLGGFFEARKKNTGIVLTPAYLQLTVDQFQLISDWRAFAVLNLVQTTDFKNSASWIARRLGLSVEEVKETLARLKRLEMLIEKDSKLSRATSKYRTTDDVSNSSLRQSHAQTLELANAALENEPVERRDFTWLTFPFDPSKMKDTKTLIRKFQDDLIELNEHGARPTEVYRLAVQLFPLTKTSPRNNGDGL